MLDGARVLAFHDLTPVLTGNLPILATMYVLLVRGTEGIPPQTASIGTQPNHDGPLTYPQRRPPKVGLALFQRPIWSSSRSTTLPSDFEALLRLPGVMPAQSTLR